MQRLCSAILCLGLLAAGSSWAWESVAIFDLVPYSVRSRHPELVNGESITIPLQSGETTLVPRDAELSAFVSSNLPLEDSRVAIESLRLISMNQDERTPVSIDELTVYNILRSISRMQGIEYFSERRNRMRVLFEESHAISQPDDMTPVPDPHTGRIADTDIVYARQKDGTFGDHVYEITYRRLSNGLMLDLTNLERLRFGFFPAVSERGMRILIYVTPIQGGVLIYSMALADAPGIPGLAGRIAISFENRLNAVVNWLASELRFYYLTGES